MSEPIKWDRDTIERISDNIKKASEYIKIYNYIFNKDVNLPVGVFIQALGSRQDGEDLPDRRGDLKSALKSFNRANKDSGELSVTTETEVKPLTLKISSSLESELQEFSHQLLAFSQVIGRRDRREMKIAAVNEEKVRVDSKVSINQEKDKINTVTSLIHTLHGKSEKNQTWMPGVGTYNNEMKRSFGSTAEEIKGTARKVKSFVQTLEAQEEKNIQKIGHLMFVTEVQRNRAAALTSAMFLDDVAKTGKVDFNKFPMQVRGAVDANREIGKRYIHSLPVARRLDEGKPSKTKIGVENLVLKKEGELLIVWLAGKGELGLVASKEALECMTEIVRMSGRNSASSLSDFDGLRKNIIKHTNRTDVPVDFAEFKNWTDENSIVDTLKEIATTGLQDKIKNSLEVLDRKILADWYNIDANKLYNNNKDKDYSRNRSLSEDSKESTTSNSSNDRPPRKIVKSKSESNFDIANNMRSKFENKEVSASLRNSSAELEVGLRSRSKDAYDNSRSR